MLYGDKAYFTPHYLQQVIYCLFISFPKNSTSKALSNQFKAVTDKTEFLLNLE